MKRSILRSLALAIAAGPGLLLAQITETKMGVYLHTATAAANGGIYAGYSSIGYQWPSIYNPATDWVGLPNSIIFDTREPIFGSATCISHDGSVVGGYMSGYTLAEVPTQFAVYWVNGVQSVIPAPPDDPAATSMSVTGVSGDGTTLLVQDNVTPAIYPYGKVETYVYNIAAGTFTSLGFLGSTTQQTFATAINSDGTVVAGYSNVDNGDELGFVWKASTGVTLLGFPASNPGTHYLLPTCVSDDGTTIFGQLTEWNGWVGFRYNTTTGYQGLGDLSPTACTADGTTAVGIENIYFPGVWSLASGGGYVDHLVTASGTAQALGTTSGPATISPDGTAVTVSGPDIYFPEGLFWSGAWKITLPVPMKVAPIAVSLFKLATDYQTTLTEPAGTLTQYAEFNTGATAALVKGPHYASSFTLRADGSFTYVPKPGYISAGVDPENGTPTDSFTYNLKNPNGTSAIATVQITVYPPAPPNVDPTPTFANVTGTTATLGGNILDNGGAAITEMGIVYSAITVNSNPQLGGDGVTAATATVANGLFTINVSGLTPNTGYTFAAYATNSLGTSYSSLGYFSTPATLASWQQTWFANPAGSDAAANADPYHTGVSNVQVFAFFGPNQDPSTVNATLLPKVQMSGGSLYYSFTEPAGVSGVTYGAQSNTDLGTPNWQSVPDTGSGTQHIFSVPIADNPHLFMRLMVTVQ